MRREGGQATVGGGGLLLLVAMLFAALAVAVTRTQAWGVGDHVLHGIVCAVAGGCEDGPDARARVRRRDRPARAPLFAKRHLRAPQRRAAGGLPPLPPPGLR